MKKSILMIFLVITLTSCVAVNELTSWDDKKSNDVTPKPNKIILEKILSKPFPDTGLYKGLGKKLESKAVKNKIEIKHIRWKNRIYFYDVFFYQKDDKNWYVLDAVKWHKNVKF